MKKYIFTSRCNMEDRLKRWEELSEILDQDSLSFIKEFNDITLRSLNFNVSDTERDTLYMAVQAIKEFLNTGDQLIGLIDVMGKRYGLGN